MVKQAVLAHPVHEEHRHPGMNQVGLWLFFLSEAFLFACLASGRFYIAGVDRPEHLNQALGLVITSILLLSSYCAYRAESAFVHGNREQSMNYLLGTIVLGLVFVAGVSIEWSTAEFSISEPYGTAFFTMTGIHATHVLSGIVILGLVLRLARRGHFSQESHWGIEASIKYWHFVDVVWVFFYPILYLVSW